MPRPFTAVAFAFVLLIGTETLARNPFQLVNFRKSKDIAKNSQLLTEENGPWMIFVASFAGEGAEAEARDLVTKLRSDFKMKAYLHKQNYDFTSKVQGKGFDKFGRPKQMRYRNGASYDEVAVLVGDFQSVDDPALQKQMQAIKYASAASLSLRGDRQNPTTRRFAGIHSVFKTRVRDQKKSKGPLRNAFATRNPMTRRTNNVGGLDPFLVEWNKDVKFSLLDNPGKYSVQVASFRGQVVIDQKKIHEIESQKSKTDNRIASTDDKAEDLTRILRAQGIEAWVYHDHHESIVTVGSFDEIGTKMKNGTIELKPDVAKIIEAFGPTKRRLPGSGNMALSGVQPKATKPEHGGYVFDVAPQPVQVPRRSIGNDYLSRK